MELTLPAAKRIKLEHSYAVTTGTIRIECPEVEEEDPLKICPEDFAIKVENEEDIVIKQEELGDVDANQSVEYFNLPNISQQLENHSHAHNTTLLPDEENDSVNNETDCLELEDNCDITVKMDPFILENDMVPKQVFLEFQQNYEKTIRDLKSQNERILSVAERVTKENGEVLQGTLVNSPSFDQQTLQTHAELVNEITRLKDELRESKSKEALLETKVNIREQSLETTRSTRLLQEGCDGDKKMYLEELRNNPHKCRFEEADLELMKSKKRVKELQELYHIERKTNLCLINQRDRLLIEQECKIGQSQKQMLDIQKRDEEIQLLNNNVKTVEMLKNVHIRILKERLKQAQGQIQKVIYLKTELSTKEGELTNAEKKIDDLTIQLSKKEADWEKYFALTLTLIDLEKEISVKKSELTMTEEKIYRIPKEAIDYVRLQEEWLMAQQREEELKEAVKRIVDLGQDLTDCRSLLKQKTEDCESVTRELEKPEDAQALFLQPFYF